MSTVDNRVVSMTFDNAVFEKRLASTLESLDSLKKSLDMSNAQGSMANLTAAANSVDLSKIADAVESINSKFSIMGAAAFAIISRLTNAAIDMAKRVAGVVWDPMIAGGKQRATNIEQAKFMFRGLGMDVESSMESARLAVTGTAYGLDSAAKAAAQLGGSGLQAGEDMTGALRGIAGIAAMTNSSYDEMADIFIAAAGKGKVMSNELGRISHRGVNAAAALAKEWGLTEAQVRQMATNGEISFDMFAKGMDGAFGEHATKANETYTGSLANMRAALARIGASFFGPRMEQQRDFFNALSPVIDNVNKSLQPLITSMLQITGSLTKSAINVLDNLSLDSFDVGIKNVVAGIRNLVMVAKQVGGILKEAFSRVFPPGSVNIIETVTGLFVKLSKTLVMNKTQIAAVTNALASVFAFIRSVGLLLIQVFGYIGEAFRTVFPPSGVKIIESIGMAFRKMSNVILTNRGALDGLKNVFAGIFAIVAIVIEVIKELVKGIVNLVSSFTSINGGGILSFLAKMGDNLVEFKKTLVDGGAIARFFDGLVSKIKTAVIFLADLKNGIVGFFKSTKDTDVDGALSLFDRLKERFKSISDVFKFDVNWGKFLGPFQGFFSALGSLLSSIWGHIKNWFSELKTKLGEELKPGDFSTVLDAINVGLLGGIGLLIANFMRNGVGLNLNFFGDIFKSDGIFGSGMKGKIEGVLDSFTGRMEAMQTSLKSDALLKIAAAIALLSVSVIALSMVDSAALTKALVAMTVGFGQLIGAMTILTKLQTGPMGAAGMIGLATGLILIAGAIGLLSLSVLLLSRLSWEELAKGLTGVTVLLGIMVGAAVLLSKFSGSLMRTGISIMFLAVALNILAIAMKIFATMSWEEMGKGLVGVAGGLLIIAGAMHLMPGAVRMMLLSVSLLAVGVALNVIAIAMKIFATMSWEQIGKGILGVAGGLLAIALAMRLMPLSLPLTAAGLVMVGFALNLIAGAMKLIATMSWEEMGRGLAGMAGALIILAGAAFIMSGTLGGSLAITMIALSLGSLYLVVKQFASLSFAELGMGLLGLAAALAVIGLAGLVLAPIVLPLMGLGVALILIGTAFGLFGLGALAAGTALMIFVSVGKAGFETFLGMLTQMLTFLPTVAEALAKAVLSFAQTFLDGAGPVVVALGVLIGHILDTLKEVIPKLIETIGVLVSSLLDYLEENFPRFVEVGIGMLMALMEGVADNIKDITKLAIEIVTEFLTGIAESAEEFIEAGVLLITNLIKGISKAYVDIFTAGAEALVEFLAGVASNVLMVIDAGFKIVIEFINGLAESIRANRPLLAEAGLNLLDAIFGGIIGKAVEVFAWFSELPMTIVGAIGSVLTTLKNAGVDFIVGLWNGINERIRAVRTWFQNLKNTVFGWVGSVVSRLKQKGVDFIVGLWNGINERIRAVTTWFQNLKDSIFGWVGSVAGTLTEKGRLLIDGLQRGVTNAALAVAGWFGRMRSNVLSWIGNTSDWLWASGRWLIEGLGRGMESLRNWAAEKAKSIAKSVVDPFGIVFREGSPSKVTMQNGKFLMEGLVVGMNQGAPAAIKAARNAAHGVVDGLAIDEKDLTKSVTDVIRDALSKAADQMSKLDEFNPTITPVLDLTNVRKDAKSLSHILGLSDAFGSGVSYNQAQRIASTRTAALVETSNAANGAGEIRFEQIINAPTRLSTADIYRQTRNQIEFAKEELSIP